MVFETIEVRGGCIYIGGLSGRIPTIDGPLFALLPAFDEEEYRLALSLIPSLLRNDCTQIMCIGTLSVQLHDGVDSILEDRFRWNVATTFHEDALEACEQFAFEVGIVTPALLALIADHPVLVNALRRAIVS